MVFEYIRAVASILAAVVALFGLYLGVTRSARVRRREQLFRESLTAMPEHDRRRRLITELHRAAVAELVARQLTGSWRVVWPWLAWITLAATWGQTGYLAADYLGADAPWSLVEFLIATIGDAAIAPITVVFVTMVVIPRIFWSYRKTLLKRAELARRMFDGESIERPEGLFDMARFPADPMGREAGSAKKVNGPSDDLTADDLRGLVRMYGQALVVGVFASALGFQVGVQVWIAREPGDQPQAFTSVRGLFLLSFLLLALTTASTGLAWVRLLGDVRTVWPPRSYPESTDRTRTALGSRGSRHGVRPAARRVAGPVKRQAAPAARRSRRAVPRRPGRRRLRWPARLRWPRPRRQ